MKSRSPSKLIPIRRNADQWREIMLAYEQSGLTQEAFCSRESLAPSTFHKWRKNLATEKPNDQEDPLFVELSSLPTSAKPSWDIELSLSECIVLRIRQSS